jgi:hypothetical protein
MDIEKQIEAYVPFNEQEDERQSSDSQSPPRAKGRFHSGEPLGPYDRLGLGRESFPRQSR